MEYIIPWLLIVFHSTTHAKVINDNIKERKAINLSTAISASIRITTSSVAEVRKMILVSVQQFIIPSDTYKSRICTETHLSSL